MLFAMRFACAPGWLAWAFKPCWNEVSRFKIDSSEVS
jgi:hypothetical protein